MKPYTGGPVDFTWFNVASVNFTKRKFPLLLYSAVVSSASCKLLRYWLRTSIWNICHFIDIVSEQVSEIYVILSILTHSQYLKHMSFYRYWLRTISGYNVVVCWLKKLVKHACLRYINLLLNEYFFTLNRRSSKVILNF